MKYFVTITKPVGYCHLGVALSYEALQKEFMMKAYSSNVFIWFIHGNTLLTAALEMLHFCNCLSHWVRRAAFDECLRTQALNEVGGGEGQTGSNPRFIGVPQSLFAGTNHYSPGKGGHLTHMHSSITLFRLCVLLRESSTIEIAATVTNHPRSSISLLEQPATPLSEPITMPDSRPSLQAANHSFTTIKRFAKNLLQKLATDQPPTYIIRKRGQRAPVGKRDGPRAFCNSRVPCELKVEPDASSCSEERLRSVQTAFEMEYRDMESSEAMENGMIPVASEDSAFLSAASSATATARSPRRRARPRAPAATPGHSATGVAPTLMAAPSTSSSPFGFAEGASYVAATPQALAYQYLVQETQNLRAENASLQQKLHVFQHLLQNRERLVSVLRTLGMDAHISDPSS
ncbi:uncharacterized protein [Penaeus vannamei]|uniref:uncharacterized protein n=1 Tax=Penaeus vannamei TaxID=6689 RepID=UPI00387F55DE